MAAARVARVHVVLGAMDDIDFLHPVQVGDIAFLRLSVEASWRCSIEVGSQGLRRERPESFARPEPSTPIFFVKLGRGSEAGARAGPPWSRGLGGRGAFVEAHLAAPSASLAPPRRRAAALDTVRRGKTSAPWCSNPRAPCCPRIPVSGPDVSASSSWTIYEAGGILSMRLLSGPRS